MTRPLPAAPKTRAQKKAELRALLDHLRSRAPVLTAEERALLEALPDDVDLEAIRAALTRGSPVAFGPEVGAPSDSSTPADAAPADLDQSSLVGERGVGISVHALIASLGSAADDLAVRVRAALARRGIF